MQHVHMHSTHTLAMCTLAICQLSTCTSQDIRFNLLMVNILLANTLTPGPTVYHVEHILTGSCVRIWSTGLERNAHAIHHVYRGVHQECTEEKVCKLHLDGAELILNLFDWYDYY